MIGVDDFWLETRVIIKISRPIPGNQETLTNFHGDEVFLKSFFQNCWLKKNFVIQNRQFSMFFVTKISGIHWRQEH